MCTVYMFSVVEDLYTTPQNVRDLLGLSVDEAPDSVLTELIEKAQYVFLHYVQIEVIDEDAKLDVTGTTIRLTHPFLADRDFDKQITADDVEVYGWLEADDPMTRERVVPSTIFPDYGILVFQTSLSKYERVTVTYSYYTCKMDWNLADLAVAYYAGMLWVAREEFLVPDDLAIGGVRIRQRQPWERLRQEFQRIIYHMTSLPMDIVTYRKIMKPARGSGVFFGPGTVLEVESESEDL